MKDSDRKGYSLTVVLMGPRLSAANKRAVKRACSLHRLFHKRLGYARTAASAISMLNAVARVDVERIERRHVYSYEKGTRL